jgi:hypothetical protein
VCGFIHSGDGTYSVGRDGCRGQQSSREFIKTSGLLSEYKKQGGWTEILIPTPNRSDLQPLRGLGHISLFIMLTIFVYIFFLLIPTPWESSLLTP